MRRRSLFASLAGVAAAPPVPTPDPDEGPSRYDDPDADLPDPGDPDHDPSRDDDSGGDDPPSPDERVPA